MILFVLFTGYHSNTFNDLDGIFYSRGECMHSLYIYGYNNLCCGVQDQGSYRITLTHHQGKEELNDSFTTPADDYERYDVVFCVIIMIRSLCAIADGSTL